MGGVLGRRPARRGLRRARRQDSRGRGKLVRLAFLLIEHGDDIEADLLHYFGIDLIDFHRGVVSARRINVLIDDLLKRPDSSLVRALNDGKPGWSPTDHLLADVWQLLVQVNSKDPSSAPDHPVRAEMEARARAAAKATRVAELKARFNRLKGRYTKR